jgi:hypothetical protein
LDEVGGVDGIVALGGGEFELFRIEFQAGAVPGEVVFAGNPAEEQTQHIVTVFDMTSVAVNPLQVVYGTTSIDVVGPAAALSARASVETNFANPLDVNGDRVVSPLDALLIISRLGSQADAASSLVDVNGDGATTPLDALLVIGELGGGTPRAAMSARASVVETVPAVVVPVAAEAALTAPVAHSVDVVFADLGDRVANPQTGRLPAMSRDDLFDRWSLPDQSDADKIGFINVDDLGHDLLGDL